MSDTEETVIFRVAKSTNYIATPVNNNEKKVEFTFSKTIDDMKPMIPIATSTPYESKTTGEVRRLRIDLIRSSYKETSHEKCQGIISNLRKRVIQLNLKLDRKDRQILELCNQRGSSDAVASGLMKVIDKLQAEKEKLAADLEEKIIELQQCIDHGETLQQQVEEFTKLSQASSSDSIVQDLKKEFETQMEAYETVIKTMKQQREEDQRKLETQNSRIQNLNVQVLKLETENAVLRKDLEVNNDRPGTPNRYRNNNSNYSPRGSFRPRTPASRADGNRSPMTPNNHNRNNNNNSSNANYGWWY